LCDEKCRQNYTFLGIEMLSLSPYSLAFVIEIIDLRITTGDTFYETMQKLVYKYIISKEIQNSKFNFSIAETRLFFHGYCLHACENVDICG
jgi:hypothetical protein